MASDRAPEQIQTYRQGELASSAVGTPGEDVSGQIIGKGVQQLAAGVTDFAQGLDQAQEIYAQFQAEEYASEYDKRAAMAQAHVTAEFADNPAGMQSAYEAKLDEISTSLGDQMKNDRARVKFETYTRRSKNNWLTARAKETTAYIEKQNAVSAATQIQTAIGEVPKPIDAATFPEYIARIRDLGSTIDSDPKYRYALQGEQQKHILAASAQAFTDGFHSVVDEDPYGAAAMLEKPEFTQVLRQTGLKDEEIRQFTDLAYAGIQNSAAHAELRKGVNAVEQLSQVLQAEPGTEEFNKAAADYEEDRQNAIIKYYNVGGKEREYLQAKADLAQFQLLKRDLQVSSYRKGDGKAKASATVADQVVVDNLNAELKAMNTKFFTKTGDAKKGKEVTKFTGTLPDYSRAMQKLYIQYEQAKAIGAIPQGSKAAQKFEQKLSSLGNAARLALADTKPPSMFSQAWFAHHVKSADDAAEELASNVAIFADSQNMGDALKGAVFASMYQDSSVELNRIVQSPEFSAKLSAQTSDAGRSGVYREAMAQAYAGAWMKTRAKYQLPGTYGPGQVVFDIGKKGEHYRITSNVNANGHYIVEREPTADPDRNKIAAMAVKKTLSEEANRLLRAMSTPGGVLGTYATDLAKAGYTFARDKMAGGSVGVLDTEDPEDVLARIRAEEDARTAEQRRMDNDLSR